MNICYQQELAMLVHCYTLYTVHCTGTLYNVLNNQIYQDYKTSLNNNYILLSNLSSTKDICRISSHQPFLKFIIPSSRVINEKVLNYGGILKLCFHFRHLNYSALIRVLIS